MFWLLQLYSILAVRAGRKLLAQNLPANQAASTAALNATGTGRQALALYGEYGMLEVIKRATSAAAEP